MSILVNALITPDGTRIESRSVHDYITHHDKNGKVYMVDGGRSYLRRSNHGDEWDVSYTSEDSHVVLRDVVTWGKLDKKGGHSYIKIKDMSRAHITAIIVDGYTGAHVDVMLNELDWRDEHETKSEAKRLEIQREASY